MRFTFVSFCIVLLSLVFGLGCQEEAVSMTNEPTVDEQEADDEVEENQNIQEQDDETEESGSCIYPQALPSVEDYGDVVPNLIWENAYLPATSETGERPQGKFSFESFFCDDAYAQYDSITMIMVTDWCPFCPDYMDLVESRREELEDARTLVLWLDLENNALQPATTAEARLKVGNHASTEHGIIVGIADANRPDAFDRFWDGAPFGGTIRKRDMRIVAKETIYDGFEARMVDVANNLERDWAPLLNRAQGLDVDGFWPTCTLNDEELSEPNDDFIDAAPIDAGVWLGAICQQPPVDTYFVPDGVWDVELLYDVDFGKLALEFYDSEYTEEPLRSDSQAGEESLEINGSGFLRVRTGAGATSGGMYSLNLVSSEG